MEVNKHTTISQQQTHKCQKGYTHTRKYFEAKRTQSDYYQLTFGHAAIPYEKICFFISMSYLGSETGAELRASNAIPF